MSVATTGWNQIATILVNQRYIHQWSSTQIEHFQLNKLGEDLIRILNVTTFITKNLNHHITKCIQFSYSLDIINSLPVSNCNIIYYIKNIIHNHISHTSNCTTQLKYFTGSDSWELLFFIHRFTNITYLLTIWVACNNIKILFKKMLM